METKFKIGDQVIIDNLDGGVSGKIGHIGKITEIDGNWYHLEPYCVGGCWNACHLRPYLKKGKPSSLILIPVPKI